MKGWREGGGDQEGVWGGGRIVMGGRLGSQYDRGGRVGGSGRDGGREGWCRMGMKERVRRECLLIYT